MTRTDATASFDLHSLKSGDPVEVFIDAESGWRRGRFEITAAGVAIIELPGRQTVALAEALRNGIRCPKRGRTS